MNNIPPSDEGEKEVRIQKNAVLAKCLAFIAKTFHTLGEVVEAIVRVIAIKNPPENQIVTSSNPSSDSPVDSPSPTFSPALSDARRQAENAQTEARRIRISVVERTLVSAEHVASLAEDAAKRFANLDSTLSPQPSGVGCFVFEESRLIYQW